MRRIKTTFKKRQLDKTNKISIKRLWTNSTMSHSDTFNTGGRVTPQTRDMRIYEDTLGGKKTLGIISHTKALCKGEVYESERTTTHTHDPRSNRWRDRLSKDLRLLSSPWVLES